MNWKLTAVLLPIFYLGFLILGLPAGYLAGALDIAPEQLSFSRVEGTALSGRASDVRISQVPLGDVGWRLAPLALLTGCLEFHLTMRVPGLGQGHGSIADCLGSRRYLKGVTAKVAMDELTPVLGTAVALLAPTGRMDLVLESIRQEGEAYVDAEGQLLWHGAVVGRSPPVRLGDVAIDLGVEEERLLGAARNEGGDVELRANISLDPSGGFEIQGSLKPRANRGVQQALATVASRQSDGSYALHFKGSL